MSQRHAGSDEVALAWTFERVDRWPMLRAILSPVMFLTMVWAPLVNAAGSVPT